MSDGNKNKSFSHRLKFFTVVRAVSKPEVLSKLISAKVLDYFRNFIGFPLTGSSTLTPLTLMFHFYNPLKTSQNLWFSDAFRGLKK